MEGILLYHILITVELDLHWAKDINVSIRNFYRSHTKVQCLTVLNHYHKLLTKLPHVRYLLALCTLSLTSIYSCSCFTPASETVNRWIISFSLSWCSGKKKIVHRNLYLDPPIVLKYWINPNILCEVSLICLTHTFRVT